MTDEHVMAERIIVSDFGALLVETHPSQFVAHSAGVGRGPVDALAARTPYEAFLRAEHVGRHACFNLRLGRRDHWFVAERAAGEDLRKRIDAERVDDLLQLFAKVIAFNQEHPHVARRAWCAPITREQRPTFRAGVAQQCSSREVRPIGGVLSDEPQPGGQPTEHLVYGEAVGRHASPPHDSA